MQNTTSQGKPVPFASFSKKISLGRLSSKMVDLEICQKGTGYGTDLKLRRRRRKLFFAEDIRIEKRTERLSLSV